MISIFGTLAHFLYDISNHNKVIGLFCAVNESTWEHIKIALTPTILWGLLDGFAYGMCSSYFLAKFISLIVIIVLIPLLFYGYKFVLKNDLFILDILIFYVSIIVSQLLFNYIINYLSVDYFNKYIFCIGTFVIFGFYMVLTLFPIKNFIFKDPITNKYGFDGHK